MNYLNLRLKMESFIKSNWLFAVSLVDLLGASLFMPLFGTHLRSLGMTHFNVGLINTAFHGTQLISGPIVGNWSDIYGRKPILLITVTICATCYFLLGFSSSFVIILSLRIILGILKHTQSLCKALVADVMPPNEQTMSHGKLNAVTSFGFMIGPVLGGHIIEMDNGFMLVSIMACFIFLLNSVIIWIFVPKNQTKSKAEYKSLIYSMTTSLKELLNINWRNSWDIHLVKFLFGFCMSLYYSTYVFTVQEKFNLSQRYIGYTVSFQGLIATIFSMSAGKLNDLYNVNTSKFTQLCHYFLILSLSFLGLGFASSYEVYILGIISLQASGALLRIITTEVLLERSSPEHRGSVVGTNSSIISVSKLFGPLITGFIADQFGHSYISFLASVTAFVTCLLCLGLKQSQQIRKSV